MSFPGFKLLSGGLTAASTDDTASIRDFIRQRVWIEQTHDLARIASQFADQVMYWDIGSVDQAFIRKDKADYLSRWPVTSQGIATLSRFRVPIGWRGST